MSISTRLLLVTLLTVAVASTTLTTTSESPANVTTGNLNTTSFTTPAIIVEVATDPTNGTITTDNATDKTVEWVDLSGQDKALNNLSPNDTKIETNAVVGDAPKMVMEGDDDDNDDNDKEAVIRPIPIDTGSLVDEEEEDDDDEKVDEDEDEDEDDDEVEPHNSTATATFSESYKFSESSTTPTSTTTTTRIPVFVTKKPSSKSSENKDSNELDGVILTTDDYEKMDFFENVNETNTDIYDVPMTFWERTNLFFEISAHEHTTTSILVLAILFSIVVLLAFLVIREFLKKRRSHYRQHRLTSITADLYNTSSCSHRYEKVILPDNKEVTMQLMSADNSTDMV